MICASHTATGDQMAVSPTCSVPVHEAAGAGTVPTVGTARWSVVLLARAEAAVCRLGRVGGVHAVEGRVAGVHRVALQLGSVRQVVILYRALTYTAASSRTQNKGLNSHKFNDKLICTVLQ